MRPAREHWSCFAIAGADQAGFTDLYKSCNFEGIPPNLQKVAQRF